MHDAGLHGGSRAHREGFFAPALFEAEANETGRVQRDGDAAVLGAVAVKLFAAPPQVF
jgi:hypothetical protein